VSGYQRVSYATADDTVAVKSATATCPSGKIVIGGGYAVSETTDTIFVRLNGPDETTAWTVLAARTSGTGAWALEAIALCASSTP